MDEELKALLSQADAGGANDDELRQIIRDYMSQKKKDSLASEEVSPSPSQLETDSTEFPSTGSLDGEEVSQDSDFLVENIRGEQITIPAYQANVLLQAVENSEDTQYDVARQKFSMDKFIEAYYPSDLQSQITGQFIEDRRERVSKGIADYFLPDEKYDIYVNAYRKAESEEEKKAIQLDVVNEIFQDGIDTEEGQITLLSGISDRVATYARGEVERDVSFGKIISALDFTEGIGMRMGDASKFTEEDYEIIPETADDLFPKKRLKPEAIARERELFDEIPLEEVLREEMGVLGNAAAQVSGETLRELIPEEILNDQTELNKLESYFLDQFGLGVDLSGDEYIGGGDYYKRFAGGSGSAFKRSVLKGLHGVASFQTDVLKKFTGENAVTRFQQRTVDGLENSLAALDDNIPIPLDTFSEKVEGLTTKEKIGEFAARGALGIPGLIANFVMADELVTDNNKLVEVVEDNIRTTAESGPMMLAAIAAGIITKGKFTKAVKAAKTPASREAAKAALIKSQKTFGAQNLATFGAVSTYGMATTYSDVRDKDWFNDMDALERAAYVSAYGAAEGIPAMVTASIGKRMLSALTQKGARSWVSGYLKQTGIQMLEEGATEATTAGVQYLLEVSANPRKAFNSKEFNTAIKDGAYAGMFMVGGMGATGAVGKVALSGIYSGTLALYSPGTIKDGIKIERLQKQYDQQNTRNGRVAVGEKLVEALQSAAKNKKEKIQFYEHIRENAPEAYENLMNVQRDMIKLGIQYNKVDGADAKGEIKTQMESLYERRASIEKEQGASYVIDGKSESKRILDNVSKVDDLFRGYGGLFQDGDSVEVTSENVDEVSQILENTTGENISRFDNLGSNSGQQVVQSLKNAMNIVRSLSKAGNFNKLVVHRTADSFETATGNELSRGLWSKKGEIHLFAPAVKENTAYHEAYHDVVIESLGEEAMRNLALDLYNGLSGDLKTKYEKTLESDYLEEGETLEIKNLFLKGRAIIAEEFLVELLADITSEDVGIEFKRSLINRFGDSIKRMVESSTNIKFQGKPKLEDLVDSVQKMTGQLREGEQITALDDVAEASKRMGYAVMATSVDDLENKEQKTEARLRDVEEVTDASRYAEAMAAAIERDKELGRNLMIQVSPLTTEDVQKMLDDGAKLFMTKDGLAGAYVTADGYMGGLFKNADSQLGRVSVPLQDVRRSAGGKFFDAYATKLENMYVDNGFKPVARLDFNPEFAPEGWDAETSPLKDQPDVVFFVDGEGNVGEGIRMEEYGEAFDYASDIANGRSQSVLTEVERQELADEIEKQKLETPETQEGTTESESLSKPKEQGPLTKKVANMLDKSYPNPSIKRDARRKNPVSIQDDTSNQLSSFTYNKKEIIEILIDSGMTKSAAKDLYNKAVAYKTGRIAGKKEAMKVAAKVERERRKLSTEAKNLRNKLEEVMNKSKTFKEFMVEAIKIVDERMKANKKTPFTRGQLARLLKAVAAAHRTSSKKVKDSGLDAMQSAIDRISTIFDERDAKAALQQYLDGIRLARKLQDRLKRMSKTRKKGEALKSRATYIRTARILSGINPALIPQSELQSFVVTIMNTIDSMSTATAKFDKEEEVYVGSSPEKIEANLLSGIVSNFKAMEELGRQAVFVARAERMAEKNNTSFQGEYDKITKNYERSRLSASRRAILNYIDEYNENNQNDQLDPSNPAHVEKVIEELARQAAEKDELKKEAIINDVMIPRVVMNIEKILEDSQLAEILGVFKAEDLDVNALRERLNQLDRIHIINLDYKIDDYVVNDSKFGIGYLHSLVMGKLDFPKRLRDIMKSKNLKARDKVVLRLMDTVDSFLRNLIVTDNKTMAKLRVALGLAGMETAFSKADFIHSQLVELMNNEINEIEKEGGSVTTRFDRAIMQVFSMSRQIPSVEVEAENAAAIWYNQLRDSMKSTVEYYEKENKTALTKSELEEIKDAYNFLFSNTNDIQGLQDKVRNQRPELIRFVDFMVDVHNSQAPSFSNYVERYLGKELVLEDNYTPFDIRVKNKNQDVEDILKIQRGMQMALQATTLSKTKKVAGSSFERNARSLSGGRNIIGLDFISINERTLRENTILSNTVGDVAKASFVLNSDAVSELIPSEPMRKELEKKFMTYVAQDTGKVPDVFKSTFTLFGRKLRNNPLNILRNAVIVKAFGGFIKQTITQSSVLISVMFQTKNPLQSIPYLMQVVAEMAIYTGRTFAQKDSKLSLDKGRYDLLKNSPVFQRDYEAGNIDPYSGAMNFDETKLEKIQKKLRDISLKNLKGTDKVAAVASWFAFYGDFLISEGVVDSFNEIDWNAEAANPNEDALSHANSMVSKDQAASTPRQAADLYTDSKDEKAAISWYARNILLPFSRFAVNKKRSIMSDLLKLGKKETAGEGAVATLGHLSELTLFASVNAIIIPALMSILFGDDEEISEEEKKKRWYRVLGQVMVDFQPLPPLSFIDDNIKGATNKFVLYPMDRMTYGDYSIGDEDGYERWKRTEGGIDVYTPIQKAIDGDVFGVIGSVAGPYGDYIADVSNTIDNLSTPGNKIISMSGQEYYVRPEDKQAMDTHFALKAGLTASQLLGFSNKELDLYIRKIDDTPKERKFRSEEELATYEEFALEYLQESNPELIKAIMDTEGDVGKDRIMNLVEGKAANPFDQQRAVNRFKSAMKPIEAEFYMKQNHPEEFAKYNKDFRKLSRTLKDGKDYYVFMRSKKEEMNPAEFSKYKEFVDTYFMISKPRMISEKIYLEENYIEE
jgi:hypothetical protein